MKQQQSSSHGLPISQNSKSISPCILPPPIIRCINISVRRRGVCAEWLPSTSLLRRGRWQPTPVLLPGKSHGRRSLGGSSVHGVGKSRTRLSDFTFTFHFRALEKEMATHSSVLAWRIPGTGEPGGLPSMRSQRVGHG